MVPLWPLLFLIASIAPVVGGFSEGAKTGLAGNVVGTILGLAIGTGWFFCLLSIRRRTLTLVERMRPAWAEVTVTAMYILTLASGLAATALAVALTRIVVQRGIA